MQVSMHINNYGIYTLKHKYVVSSEQCLLKDLFKKQKAKQYENCITVQRFMSESDQAHKVCWKTAAPNIQENNACGRFGPLPAEARSQHHSQSGIM